MWPDQVSNSGPPALESDRLPTAFRDPDKASHIHIICKAAVPIGPIYDHLLIFFKLCRVKVRCMGCNVVKFKMSLTL